MRVTNYDQYTGVKNCCKNDTHLKKVTLDIKTINAFMFEKTRNINLV